MDLRSGRIEQLTDHGVVYGYDFLADGTLVYFHRDLRTPGALIAGGKVLESVPSGVDFRVERLPRHAIAFQPPARTRQAGTILYIGPLHADVSPRWDPLIMGLVYQGFRVVAPNYPGSLGFGRTYEDAPWQAAVEELASWTDSLRPACTIAV